MGRASSAETDELRGDAVAGQIDDADPHAIAAAEAQLGQAAADRREAGRHLERRGRFVLGWVRSERLARVGASVERSARTLHAQAPPVPPRNALVNEDVRPWLGCAGRLGHRIDLARRIVGGLRNAELREAFLVVDVKDGIGGGLKFVRRVAPVERQPLVGLRRVDVDPVSAH